MPQGHSTRYRGVGRFFEQYFCYAVQCLCYLHIHFFPIRVGHICFCIFVSIFYFQWISKSFSVLFPTGKVQLSCSSIRAFWRRVVCLAILWSYKRKIKVVFDSNAIHVLMKRRMGVAYLFVLTIGLKIPSFHWWRSWSFCTTGRSDCLLANFSIICC